ncbi:prevent-host-death family protein [Desertifilum sp. FACHB-1129]|uniref:Prevent-host-death family protein n=2 Tax=Desertifilum tharense IPPAS B-1220 TaxID=1781255 RepID=A0A1E5QI95_9CYAN|nr:MULTISPECIES: prevent-host-death family protein [Desertifilum]MDA0210036.1 prevent-host-death family protein [Cyanobacteria bacterium FC1]MBD2312659.1 prevent-host-death family protein [Desertifilum sp. FACHB-1129]MBD2320441.1 prevent-host-death family protein [Desertifilum sp. FACHB-866]MBD2330569.1 prevent-host-death family protein [Desertifilum sp. FACHB-868]OEJ74380.1 prevent-host-death family protein [Desertifilum tharense IPPAS B-1220]
MTIRQLLLQEIDSIPDELLSDLLSLVRSLKDSSQQQPNIYEQLLQRIDYLEAIIGIRQGLESFNRGEGIPADQAMTALQQQFNIPPRP